MKKDNPRFRWHLTFTERRRIKTLTLQGVHQIAIARALKLNRNTVRLAQRKMNVPTKPPIPVEQIVSLLRANVARRDVAKRLKVSLQAVRRIGKQYHTRQRRDPYKKKLALVEADIRARRGSGLAIAHAHQFPYRRALRMAHQIWGPGKFIGGATEPPLLSYFPQGNFNFNPQAASASDYEKIILFVVEKCFGGVLPGVADATFARAIVGILKKSALAGMPDVVVEAFQGGLLSAMATLRQVPENGWTN